MLGYAEMTEVAIWVQTTQEATVQIRYWQQGKPETSRLTDPIRTKIGRASCRERVCSWV